MKTYCKVKARETQNARQAISKSKQNGWKDEGRAIGNVAFAQDRFVRYNAQGANLSFSSEAVMDLIDFSSCEKVNRFYGGRAGRKIAVLHEGDPWLLKFPENTRHFTGKHLPSYTSSPLSEYIGSRIYASLNIPVHEVVLGVYENKIVAACKDFAVNDTLADFAAIKNTIAEEALNGSSNSSGISGEPLSDALAVIENAEAFNSIRAEVRRRFWDMFVTDAFILNNDRNNGNWGVLVKRYSVELAPVFDNGNALFNKRSESTMQRRIEAPENIENDLDASTSFYQDENGKQIHPFAFMAQSSNPDLLAALKRFAQNLNLPAVDSIINNIPEYYGEIPVASVAQKQYYKTLLHEAALARILPLAKAL